MRRDTIAALGEWLNRGVQQIGEVWITITSTGYELRHIEDADLPDLETFHEPEAARLIATYDSKGAYRPLRTAPNLRRGWALRLTDLCGLKTALDHLYPSMLGIFLSHQRGELAPVALRETLNRQTGMYAMTKRITDDNAQAMVGQFCRSDGGCLKTILWRVSPEQPVSTLSPEKFDPAINQTGRPFTAIPMLCHEACNLLVAEARSVVKTRQPVATPAQ